MYSCVADPNKGAAAVLRNLTVWTTTLERLAGVARAQLHVHVVEREGTERIGVWLRARGVAWSTVAPFADGRFCNKLRQPASPALRACDVAVLCDTDLAFSGPIDRWLQPHGIAAKVVDGERPPLAILNEVYAAAGLRGRPAQTRCSFTDAPTYANNCNGGLYAIEGALLEPLSERWQAWALWLNERRTMLGDFGMHVDQVSFGLATHELGIAVTLLPTAANYPTHMPLERCDPACDPPTVLHYHRHINDDGLLRPAALPQVTERIEIVNAVLRRAAAEG